MIVYQSLDHWIRTFLYIVTMIVMIINFICYSVVPELRNNHGRLIRCYIFTYVISFVATVGFIYLLADDINMRLSPSVLIYGDTSCALWIQVMSFDIWWNFRNLRCDNYHSRNDGNNRFIWYALYAWVVPVLLIVPLNIDYIIRNALYYIANWLYFAIFATVSLSNILFYVSMVRTLKRQKKETAVLNEDFNQRHRVQKQGVNLYVKLSFIMGVHMVPWAFVTFHELLLIMTWIISLTELIHSISIFGCFVWKDSVKHALRERFRSAISFARKASPSNSPASDSKPDEVPQNLNCVSTAVM